MIVWVGIELPGPNYPQKVEPLDIQVFASKTLADDWRRLRKVTATSPLRQIYARKVNREEQ